LAESLLWLGGNYQEKSAAHEMTAAIVKVPGSRQKEEETEFGLLIYIKT
jgi:hypothetical protein